MFCTVRQLDNTLINHIQLPEDIAQQIQSLPNKTSIFAGRQMMEIVETWLRTTPYAALMRDCLSIYIR